MIEGGRPFLSSTADPRELRLDPEASREDDLRNVLSIFVGSTALWFRIEYTLDGVRLAIDPEDFIAKRIGADSDRDKFFRDKSQELLAASDVVVTIINPNRLEKSGA